MRKLSHLQARNKSYWAKFISINTVAPGINLTYVALAVSSGKLTVHDSSALKHSAAAAGRLLSKLEAE